ncbi:heavy metal translocating P-type ATPase [Ottowia testudinis]|uniref:Cation-translocating P-type ATPase n=1 Tax=Ottowia testudinis TaxID=2816950 RepID=A0A975CET8_9BURK|nr:cation-translocating P-type ATPase [Ottowia testudinis]QTD44229.1 cation-translocating P-type ATPase [Ottowia testudinis]
MQGASVISPATATIEAPPSACDEADRGDAAWQLLDERDEWLEFSRPLDGADAAGPGTRWESIIVFEGMHCAACAVTIEQALRTSPGVREAEVSAASHRGRVVWEEGATLPSRWMQAVHHTGYRPLPAHDAQASARRQSETRKMTWRLGVAGLCMMQVMMYATPEYFTAPGEMEPDVVHLLRWAQWVLSIPVVLFSCQPFFRNALLDLKLRRVSMDLPVALGMAITFVVSTLGTFEPNGVFGHQVYFDSLTMFVFFLLTGRWMELRMRDRTAGALEALMHRLPESVQRQSADGGWDRVSARRVRVGDVLRVLPGEAFPADGLILKGHTSADEALLTGESTPLSRGEGQRVIAGSHNVSAPVEVRVEQMGADTRYAQIVALMEQASTGKPRIAQLADRLAKPFLVFVLLAAGAACAWWWPTDPGRALMIAVAILVVTCPCALSLATPAAMLASAGALARDGVLVRRLQALEELAEVDTVVFDKTGTLTRDAFVLAQVRLRHGVSREHALSLAAALAAGSLHPVSRALVQAAEDEGVAHVVAAKLTALREEPGQGVSAVLDGGEIRLGSAGFCGVADAAADGPISHLSDAAGWMASFEFREDVRDDARTTTDALRREGMRVRLLSGDRPEAAARVGQLAGIDETRGGCTPDDKLTAMRQAQQAGGRVAMVGDGLNDGPVLAGANVSFAFGRAVPLARAQSDFVVLSDRLIKVVATRQKASRTMRIVRQNLAWAAAYNAIGVPLAMMGWVSAWLAGLGMAASSLLIVLNALRLSSNAGSAPKES